MSKRRLPHRITIQQQASGNDDYGHPNGALSGVFPGEIPAHVVDVSGKEQVRGEQVEAHVTTVVEIARGVNRPAPKMRVSFGSRTLNIEKVTNKTGRTGRDSAIFLHCTEQA